MQRVVCTGGSCFPDHLDLTKKASDEEGVKLVNTVAVKQTAPAISTAKAT
jgi:hypothetical protein